MTISGLGGAQECGCATSWPGPRSKASNLSSNASKTSKICRPIDAGSASGSGAASWAMSASDSTSPWRMVWVWFRQPPPKNQETARSEGAPQAAPRQGFRSYDERQRYWDAGTLWQAWPPFGPRVDEDVAADLVPPPS